MAQCAQCNCDLPPDAPQGVCPKCLMQLGLGGGIPETLARQSLSLPPVAKLAASFPQLEVLELRGQGGMGAVYKARQKTLDRIVALKVLPSEVGQDPAFAERFSREARALAKLNHPNIVTVFDFGQAGELYYFVMEYVDGVNLREAIAAEDLTSQQALAVVSQICDALQYAHDENVIHRDIKPENVLLDKHGRVKIADFGLAKLLDANKEKNVTLTGTQQVVGTMHYMAPEQMERPTEVDHRADIYSLGVVFYELLTGELPLGRFAPPSKKSDVSAGLDDVVLRSLEKEPDLRYQQASEVKTAVEASNFAPATSPRRKGTSLPFTVQDSLMRPHGIVRISGDKLIFEFEVTDQLLGLLRRPVRVMEVNIDDLIDVRLREGLLTTTVTLQSDYLTTFDQFPKRTRGSISFHIANDRERARQFVNELRTALALENLQFPEQPVIADDDPDPLRPARDHVAIPSTVMFLLGLFNIVLPFALFTISMMSPNAPEPAFVLSILGIPMGVLLVRASMQLYRFRAPVFCLVISLLAATPLHFGFLFGIPLAIWAIVGMRKPIIMQAFAWQREQDAAANQLPPEKQLVANGAPRPRHRRPVRRIVHWALLLVVIAGLMSGAYYYKWRWSAAATMTYDIRSTSGRRSSNSSRESLADYRKIARIVNARTQHGSNQWADADANQSRGGPVLAVKVYRPYLDRLSNVRWRIERQGRMTLGMLADLGTNKEIVDLALQSKSQDTVAQDGEIVAKWVTVRPLLELKNVVQRGKGKERQVLVLVSPLDLTNEHVEDYRTRVGQELVAMLTDEGTRRLTAMAKRAAFGKLPRWGMVVDGRLEFISSKAILGHLLRIDLPEVIDEATLQDWAAVLRYPMEYELRSRGTHTYDRW